MNKLKQKEYRKRELKAKVFNYEEKRIDKDTHILSEEKIRNSYLVEDQSSLRYNNGIEIFTLQMHFKSDQSLIIRTINVPIDAYVDLRYRVRAYTERCKFKDFPLEEKSEIENGLLKTLERIGNYKKTWLSLTPKSRIMFLFSKLKEKMRSYFASLRYEFECICCKKKLLRLDGKCISKFWPFCTYSCMDIYQTSKKIYLPIDFEKKFLLYDKFLNS
jgi:hypothetical protein